MSKIKDIAITIEELRNAAAAINDTADWLARQFNSEPAEPKPVTLPEPMKLEEVRAVLADMSRRGYTTQIRDLLHKYGAEKLSGIDPANYAALLKDAEGLSDAN
ncbi:MAG: DNA ligase [Clostridia bacterium]|nr:DNA ligase [Clostridia bacterium]